VRSADLDDVVELLGLGVEGGVQLLQSRQQNLVDLHGHGDVHGRGERVVGALRLVHVIVRVDRLLRAELTSKHFDGAVRDYLVGVHVTLGTRAGLPDH
jgi:hypothetical protein